MATDPAAQSSYRVPRSEVDNLFIRGEALPETRAGVGVVVSIDSANTCTVLINDEEIVGVVWLGLVAPQVGDTVEVEMRGDLLVIPATSDINTFLEGTDDGGTHIVSDEDPGLPAPTDINVGGSMRSADAWSFVGTEAQNWKRELNESGQGMRLFQPPTPTLTARNLITNPSGEAGTTGWNTIRVPGPMAPVSSSTDRAHSGSFSVRVQWPTYGATGAHATAPPVTGLTPGQPYTASCWVWVPAGTPDVKLNMTIDPFNNSSSAVVTTKDQWVQLTNTWVVTGPDILIDLSAYSGGMTTPLWGMAYVDALSLTITPAFFNGAVTETSSASWNTSRPPGDARPLASVSNVTNRVKYGTTSIKAVWQDSTTGAMWLPLTGLTVGQEYIFSCWVWATGSPTGTPGHSMIQEELTVSDANSNTVKSAKYSASVNEWQEQTLTWAPTTSEVWVGLTASIRIPNSDGITTLAGQSIYFDGLTVVPKPPPPTYFDGATTDTESEFYLWSGTPHLSASEHWSGPPPPSAGGPPLPVGNDAVLWSESSFEVEPNDQVEVEATFYQLWPSATGQVVLLYGALEDANPVAGDANTVVTPYGTPIPLTGSPTALTTVADTITIPATVTPPSGAVQPRTAKVGFKLVGDGDAQVVALSAAVTRTPTGWPLGSLWMDPDANDAALITVGASAQGTASVAQPWPGNATVWTRAVGVKKVVVTAPPSSGGIAMVTGMASVGQVPTNTVGFDLGLESNVAGGQFPWVRAYMNATNTSLPTTVTGYLPLAPGQTAEIYLVFRYTANPGATPHILRYPTIQCVFLPGAVVAGDGPQDPMIRYYDGDSWRPEKLLPAELDLSVEGTTLPATKANTTTALTRSATTMHTGETLILTATVAPSSATGTVAFYRSSVSSTGPWISIGTSTLTAGKATRSWVAGGGAWFFKAEYQGSAVHNGSSSLPNSVTTDVQVMSPSTTVVVPCSWAQVYNQSLAQIAGDQRVQQGYYSSINGVKRSLLAFDRSVIPAGAQVRDVTLVCKSGGWASTSDADGMVLIVGKFVNQATVPTTWPTAKVTANLSQHKVDVGGWSANLSSWNTAFEDPAFSGIAIGPSPSNSTSPTYHGYSVAPGKDQFYLKLTYFTWAMP